MNKLAPLLSLLALALHGPAMAQNNQHDYRVTHVSRVGLSALDVGSMQKNSESSVYAAAQIFYPAAHVGEGNRVDYVIVMGEYDCTAQGRWRPMTVLGFESGVRESVAEEKDFDAIWEHHEEGSLGYANWTGACQGVSTEYRLPFDFASDQGREEVLRYYRDFMQKKP